MFKKNVGFTIIEMLMYMGLISIFLVVLTQIFVSSLDVQLSTQATSTVSQDGRFLLSRFTYDVNRASAITIPLTLGSSADTLQLTIGGVSYTYAVSDGIINLSNNFGTQRLSSYGTVISGFSVTRLGNIDGKESVTIVFTLTSNIPEFPETRSFQTTIGLR